ncbi:MAG TPA: hypothetical protein DDW28_07155 [Prevotella sp.]|nr:hypothetical protein [uncultured Prevotella sp.]HBF05864.1 hypothetical protein [Candidatus Segatella violae]
MEEKEILTLHLTDEWYQKVASGEKTEEYREISLYWTRRLLSDEAYNREDVIRVVKSRCKQDYFMLGYLCGGPYSTEEEKKDRWERKLKPFKKVRFVLGYPKDNEPCIIKEIDDITVDKPKSGMCPDEWLDKYMYVIRFKNNVL